MSQSSTNLLYHLIFSTKERRPVITLDYKPRLYDYIGVIEAHFFRPPQFFRTLSRAR